MSPRKVLTIAAAITALCLAALLLVDNPEDGSVDASYLLEDPYDRLAYQDRGRWLPSGLTPYTKEMHSEHIQVSTWLMGIPYLFFDHDIAKGELASEAKLKRNRRVYGDLFQVGAALFLLVLAWATVESLRALGHDPAWALLLFLPATLWYGFSRFDFVVTTWVALAILSQLRGRPLVAAFWIGVAAMTKWWPILLLPAFLSYGLHSGRARALARGEPAPWGPALLRAVVAPGLVAAGVCLLVLGITWAWGGWDTVTYLPDWHFNVRVLNHASLLAMVSNPERLGWFDLSARPELTKWCSRLQILPAFLLGLLPLRRRRDLLTACIVVTIGVALWSKFFSPQWVIWSTSIAVLLAPRQRIWLVAILVLQGVLYVQLPLLWYFHPRDSELFWAVSYLRVVLYFLVWAGCLGALVLGLRAREPDREPAKASG